MIKASNVNQIKMRKKLQTFASIGNTKKKSHSCQPSATLKQCITLILQVLESFRFTRKKMEHDF